MVSVSDEVPSTIDDSGSVPKPSVGDLFAGGADDFEGDVATVSEAPSMTSHVVHPTQVPREKVLHTSVMSGMSGLSGEAPSTSMNFSSLAPEVEVGTSKRSMGDLSAAGVAKVDLAPAKPSSDKPLVEVKMPKKGLLGSLFTKPSKADKVEASPVSDFSDGLLL